MIRPSNQFQFQFPLGFSYYKSITKDESSLAPHQILNGPDTRFHAPFKCWNDPQTSQLKKIHLPFRYSYSTCMFLLIWTSTGQIAEKHAVLPQLCITCRESLTSMLCNCNYHHPIFFLHETRFQSQT
ncbi:hypothetical protein BRADI_1g22105v3 [Brachypodium distachyon]|uniref:Uncharacterized protein n=1 Tax=Brachypodium distachyon TaxID=15368 RepID=A0A2K2DKJ2_BRADI|nr:hypothetical protein BRADI_1g22105v3 [Brachypodium distachyon]